MSKEKEFAVCSRVDASVQTEVRAATPEEALEQGLNGPAMPSLCHQCSSKVSNG